MALMIASFFYIPRVFHACFFSTTAYHYWKQLRFSVWKYTFDHQLSLFLLSCLLLCTIGINAQHAYFETGTGIRVGTWQYNLGNNDKGDFAGNGLQYTHFSPFLPIYAQIGYCRPKAEIGIGSSFTLFMDNEMRIHQDPGVIDVDEYIFTDANVLLFHAYMDIKYFLIQKDKFKLGPRFSGGYFNPITDYPDQERLNSSWFLEGGMSGLFKINNIWIIISPAYQWNTIRAANTSAEHQLFSFGALVGVRWEGKRIED